jgi:hypothetical protein
LTVSANASATFGLSVRPEGDIWMGLRECDQFPQHRRLDDGIVIQKPDARCALLECCIRTQVASRAEPRILPKGEDLQSLMGLFKGCCEVIPGTVIHDDHPMWKGFVPGK